MNVRRLTQNEYFDSDTVSRLCFHSRTEIDEEAERVRPREEREDWGAFDDDGTLMAHIINNHYEANLNGRLVRMGGIGAVSTLPEYRSGGAIRAIFDRLLPYRRAEGETISCLYPFKHSFYRKFGYETAASVTSYEMRPQALKGFTFDGKARMYPNNCDADDFLRVYEPFSKRYNLSVKRTSDMLKRSYLHEKPLAQRRFAYLLSARGADIAYVCFDDQWNEPAARLAVTDIAWTSPEGFRAILGFLARFEADYGTIEMILPTDINLKLLVPDAYEINEAKLNGNYMLRVVDVQRALETLVSSIRQPLCLRVYGDEIIKENNGTWIIGPQGVQRTDAAPSIEMSLTALNRLICGSTSFDNALLRGDISVNAGSELYGDIFPARPIFITDRF